MVLRTHINQNPYRRKISQMHSQLFIANRIKVGFQKRDDTFTNQLAYVIYYDAKNKLRKESSWQGWRDKTIEPQDHDNTPQTGFMINKGITRGGDWFSDKTTKVRIWDPRGFEFEISVGNLMQLLMHSDVSKRDIQQACVYAWSGTELVLLPTNSTEYEESVKHTAKQSVKFSTKDLVVGHTYNVKQGNSQVVYLGRHDYYSQVDQKDKRIKYGSHNGFKQVPKAKKHVFYNTTHKRIELTDPSSLIAGLADDSHNPNVAKYLDVWFQMIESQPIKQLKMERQADRSTWMCWHQLSEHEFVYIDTKFETSSSYVYYGKTGAERAKGYTYATKVKATRVALFDPATGNFQVTYEDTARYGRTPKDDHVVKGLKLSDPRIVDLVERYEAEYAAQAKIYFDAEIQKVCNENPKQPYHPFGYHYNGDETILRELNKTYKGGNGFSIVMADGKRCSNPVSIY